MGPLALLDSAENEQMPFAGKERREWINLGANGSDAKLNRAIVMPLLEREKWW